MDLFASEQPRAALDEPETSPSREALGFGTKPMSFMTNFKRELPFDGTKKIRVKRSRLPPLDLDAAASAQRGAGSEAEPHAPDAATQPCSLGC